MLRAISFDLWFTLIWETKEDEELYLRMRLESLRDFLRGRGYEVPLETIRDLYLATRDFRMVVPPKELLRMIFMRLGLRLDEGSLEEASEAYAGSTDSFVPKVNEEAVQVLPELRKRGIRLALVTNTSFSERSIRAILRNVNLDHFDVIITSCESGFLKPQREIFSALIRRLGLTGSQVMHVGDSCYHDVIGAWNAGLRALHYPRLIHLRGASEEPCDFERIDSLRRLIEIVEMRE
ncbi:MAG: HAD family hydrolase [Candidatus Korarchaeota archaeon NZ13-K]|nr:MAG: HAD family hydrolase [Candidatus Korarchaeota archaeon NZ13-K]